MLDKPWDQVAASVAWVVDWGMRRRCLDGVTALGVDELYTGKRGKFITLVYQLESGCRRLLWMSRGKGSETLERFFSFWGKSRTQMLRYVCTDMSTAYIRVIRRCCQQALLILDKFHIVKNLNDAITRTRRSEAAELAQQGKTILKNARWIMVKNRENLKDGERERLTQILKMNLKTAKGYLLAEDFKSFWDYVSPHHAGRFLRSWIKDVLRHRSLPHFKTFARTLRSHADLILNYFEARKAFSSAAVEMMNGQVRATISAARGYRYDSTLEMALFLRLGNLPRPTVGYRYSG
jgi:transposase